MLVVVACGANPEGDADSGDDGGPGPSDASSLDASFDAQLSDDAEVDGAADAGLDPRSCEAFANAYCALFRNCVPAAFFYRDCEAWYLAGCLETDALEDTGDLGAWRAGCVAASDCRDSASLFFGTAYGSVHPCNDVPRGLRGVGEPCGSNLQCGEGTTSDGRTVPLHCWRPTIVAPVCEQGVCSLPLGEGEGPCRNRDTNDRCDEGLECFGSAAESSSCGPSSPSREVGDACESARDCSSRFCAADGTCALVLFEGQVCDPADDRCERTTEVACDATTRVCTHVDMYALPGEPCDASLDCVGVATCMDGVCVFPPVRPCACDRGWVCVDDVCEREPCPPDAPDAGA